MNLASQITEEAHRFHSFFGHKPDFIFMGDKQMTAIDDMVAEMAKFGLLRTDVIKTSRPIFMGMEIFRVDAENHLSFGCRQPSPCG